MAVWLVLVAGIQWEDRFYSGLNPVMPARASRFHGRASSRTPPFISISTLTEDEVKLLKKKKKKMCSSLKKTQLRRATISLFNRFLRLLPIQVRDQTFSNFLSNLPQVPT